MKVPRQLLRLAARVRPAVPPHLLDATVAVASMVSAAPIITTPSLSRVLVVAPHPDDETIGCGGTIAQLAASGTRVDVVVCTDGEATLGAPTAPVETARRRRAETLDACAALGVRAPIFLGLPDGRLVANLDVLAGSLHGLLRAWTPDAVFVPWPLERHPDHRAVTAALARGPRCDDIEVWGYEAHTPLHPSHLVPLDVEAVDRKRAALTAHATAGLAFSLEATLALNRWRSLGARAGRGYAEAFHVTTWDALDDLVTLGDRAWTSLGGGMRESPPAFGSATCTTEVGR